MAGRVEGGVWCRKASTALGVIFCLASSWPMNSAAQYSLRQPATSRRLAVEWALPRFDDVTYKGAVVKGAFVTPLNPRITFVAGMSLTYAKDPGVSASVAISNTFASLQFGGEGGFGTLTLTMPTTGRLTNQGYAVDAGLLIDLERSERYTARVTAIEVLINPRWHFGSEGRFGGYVGPSLVSPSGFDSKLVGRFGAFIEGLAGPARLGVEVTGATVLPSARAAVSGSSVHHARAYVGLPHAAASPDLFVRIPLDEAARAVLDVLIGLRLTF